MKQSPQNLFTISTVPDCYAGVFTFHSCVHALQRYFVSTASPSPCTGSGTIFFRPRNVYSPLPHLGQLLAVGSCLSIRVILLSRCPGSIVATGQPSDWPDAATISTRRKKKRPAAGKRSCWPSWNGSRDEIGGMLNGPGGRPDLMFTGKDYCTQRAKKPSVSPGSPQVPAGSDASRRMNR